MMNKQLNGTLKVTTESSPVNFASYVDAKYSTSTKTVVTNNNISYNYVPSLSLINDKQGGTALDEDGNIRYYGASLIIMFILTAVHIQLLIANYGE